MAGSPALDWPVPQGPGHALSRTLSPDGLWQPLPPHAAGCSGRNRLLATQDGGSTPRPPGACAEGFHGSPDHSLWRRSKQIPLRRGKQEWGLRQLSGE